MCVCVCVRARVCARALAGELARTTDKGTVHAILRKRGREGICAIFTHEFQELTWSYSYFVVGGGDGVVLVTLPKSFNPWSPVLVFPFFSHFSFFL